MEPINVDAEYRRQVSAVVNDGEVSLNRFIEVNLAQGLWVEAEGDYYFMSDWKAEQARYNQPVKPTVTPEVRELIKFARILRQTGLKYQTEIIYAALRSLGIEPDTL